MIIDLPDGHVDLAARVVVRKGRRTTLTQIEAAILAYLSRHRGDTVAKKELLRSVWGYSRDVQTRTVDTYLWRLRKKLESSPGGGVLVTEYGRGVKLTAAVRATQAPGAVLATVGLAGSLALWRDVPEQTHEQWDEARHLLLAQAEHAATLRVLQDAAGALVVTGDDAPTLLAWAQSALALPGALQSRLRIALCAVTEPVPASRERAERLLGVAGGGELLASGGFAALLPDDALRAVGQLQLHPAEPPIRLFAISRHSVLPAAPVAPFPAPPPDFVGREAALATLKTWLTADSRGVVLLGPGGIGKTSLALALVSTHLRAFHQQGGRLWIDCARLEQVAELSAALATALGIADAAIGPALAARGACLLLLDNLEHLLPAAEALLLQWMSEAPRVTVIITSRRRPTRLGLRSLEVEALSLPAASWLFARRTRSTPGYEALAADSQVVREIAAAVDGIPLAIELAANRARLMQPVRLVRRLHEDLRFLGGSTAGHPHPRQTLQDTITGSLDLLSEEERRALRCCAVLRGALPLPAVEHLIQPHTAQPTACIQQLCDASLLQVRVLSQINETAFAMYEPIRRLLLAEMGAAEQQQVRIRFARWLAGAAQRWLGSLRSGQEQARAVQLLLHQQVHLFRAAGLLLDAGEPMKAADILEACLLFVCRLHTAAVVDYLPLIQRLPETPRALWLRAAARFTAGEHQQARVLIEDALGRPELSRDVRLALLVEQLEVLCLQQPQRLKAHARALMQELEPPRGRDLSHLLMVSYMLNVSSDDASHALDQRLEALLRAHPGHRWEAAQFTILRLQRGTACTERDEQALLHAAAEMERLGCSVDACSAMIVLCNLQSARKPSSALRIAARLREMRPEQDHTNFQQAITMVEIAPLLELGRHAEARERLARLTRQAQGGHRFTSDGRLALRRAALAIREQDAASLLSVDVPAMIAPAEAAWVQTLGWVIAAVAHGWQGSAEQQAYAWEQADLSLLPVQTRPHIAGLVVALTAHPPSPGPPDDLDAAEAGGLLMLIVRAFRVALTQRRRG